MKRVLITGADSYIGTSFDSYIRQNFPRDYQVDTVDMVDCSWRKKSFAGYDAVFHVAGIAHADSGRVSEEAKARYYKVNRDLAIETAQKAKADGVRQFLFMSSAIVYGDSAPIGKSKHITPDTPPAPASVYADSKFQAERGILALGEDSFRVVVMRCPMIYGKDSKGNFPVLARLAKKLPVFPRVENQRSMLYIENLCEFVRLMVENRESGIFHPQNAQYSNTAQLVAMIAHANGKRIRLVKGFSWALRLLGYLTPMVNKAFGSLSYDMEMSAYRQPYRVCDLAQSIDRTEL